MNLTTKERVAAILADGLDAKAIALIDQLIGSVSAMAESYMRRQVTSASTTEYFTLRDQSRSVQLAAYPVTSITTVHNDTLRDYGSSTLVDSDDYVVDTNSGILHFDYAMASGARSLKVVYVGGMASTVDAFVSAYSDIAHAVEMQIVHEFRRRKDSLDGTAASLGIATSSPPGEIIFLSYSRKILDAHQRSDFCQ